MIYRLLALSIYSLYCLSSFANSDTLWIKLKYPKGKKIPQGVQIKIPADSIAESPDERGVLFLPLEQGEYQLIISGEDIKSLQKKLTAKDFSKEDTIEWVVQPVWKINTKEGIQFSQGAYGRYWQKGGINNLAVLGSLSMTIIRDKGKGSWENKVNLVYGVIKQGDNDFVNNEDRIELSTKFSRKLLKRLQFSTLLDFQTQFDKGFKLDKEGNRGELNSRFMAPAFINLSTGLDYKVKEKGWSIYYSPVSSKITLVSDTTLSSRYLPKDHEDPRKRIELGSYLNVDYKKEIMKNVTLQTKGKFFANHLKLAEGIDVNWETLLAFKVNKYIETNIRAHMIYDNDILFTLKDAEGNPVLNEEGIARKGPRTQFHEALNIGVVHRF